MNPQDPLADLQPLRSPELIGCKLNSINRMTIVNI